LTPQDEVPTWEDQIPVEATHRDMCRLATPKDKTYKTFVRKIKQIQQGSDVKVKNEFYVVPHASSTHFMGRNDIREQLSESLLPFGASKVQQRFILYGLGGSGKTQIALKFAEDNRDR
jgi:signal recognition particle GTPase